MFAVAKLVLPAPEYARFAFPSHHGMLANTGNAVAVGAIFEGVPIGLALAVVSKTPSIANLLSIAVAPSFRGQGVGSLLLQRLEGELSSGCEEIQAVFTGGSEYADAVRRMLVKQGWGPIGPRMLICRSNRESIMKAPWMHQVLLSNEFEIFPWRDLRDDERADIRAQRSIRYSEDFSPFYEEDRMEPISSLGLRHRGVVAGWMITHIVEPDTLRFTKMFVRDDLQKRARGISLLVESIKRFAAQPMVERVSSAVFAIHVSNAPMIQFARRRLGPHCTAIYYSYGASKALRSMREAADAMPAI